MKQMFFNTMRLNAHDTCNKTAWRKARNRQRQQRLVRSIAKLLASTAPASVAGSFIRQNVIQATRILQQRIDQGLALADDQK